MISAKRIAEAKAELGLVKPFHEHDDSIHIAYQWLDAQRKLNGLSKKWIALKHVIENWGGRYVSQSDVEVAAFLHPEIRGTYPYFNLAYRLTLPSEKRLLGIGSARTQRYALDPRIYTYHEADEEVLHLLLL